MAEDLPWKMEGPSVQQYNGYLQQALKEGDWWSAIDYAGIISDNFSQSPFAQDMGFILGEAYFHLGQLEIANDYFSTYLHHIQSPRHFEKAIEYKFNIAEQFKNGAKKPLFGSHKMPKIVPAKEDALKIYEEVVATLPHSELAAQALMSKANLQAELEEYTESIETLDLLIHRFPKHDLAAAAFLEKIQVFAMQCQGQNFDTDLLDLAEVTLRKFRLAFPREPRIAEGEKKLSEMREIFAANLLQTGRFFQKTKKIPAAILYYNQVMAQYPATEAATLAKDALEQLQPSKTPPHTP